MFCQSVRTPPPTSRSDRDIQQVEQLVFGYPKQGREIAVEVESQWGAYETRGVLICCQIERLEEAFVI